MKEYMGRLYAEEERKRADELARQRREYDKKKRLREVARKKANADRKRQALERQGAGVAAPATANK